MSEAVTPTEAKRAARSMPHKIAAILPDLTNAQLGHAAATGDSGIAVAVGPDSTAQAGPDGWIVLAHWAVVEHKLIVTTVRAVKVGGPEGVRAGVSYRLKADGSFVEVTPVPEVA